MNIVKPVRFSDVGVCPLPLSALGTHQFQTYAGPVHSATVTVSSCLCRSYWTSQSQGQATWPEYDEQPKINNSIQEALSLRMLFKDFFSLYRSFTYILQLPVLGNFCVCKCECALIYMCSLNFYSQIFSSDFLFVCLFLSYSGLFLFTLSDFILL